MIAVLFLVCKVQIRLQSTDFNFSVDAGYFSEKMILFAVKIKTNKLFMVT